ncbi:hypothetical protein L1987_07502 [Smallanthus sonchifolius]|uniref:Uncharacterized protein n=1 Tax=Smallanthus sonchifolius TaxID=185202 RepID=A0ACB9K0Q2_9ASTR|nr:hypothetical protein L1987_07502 [Smallanthus sonchifolius]
MLWSYFRILSLLLNLSFMVSTGVALPIRCEYPCQPPPSRPPYGTPPPPSPSPPIEPVYEAPPPPPSGPVYESPTPPTYKPSCEPPPPAPPLPMYGGTPPPLLPGNCQPTQNCAYPPPITDVYQPVDSASHLPLNSLLGWENKSSRTILIKITLNVQLHTHKNTHYIINN